MSQNLFQPMDSKDFSAQVTRLHSEGYRVIRCSGGQLKIGPYSYYPSTGTILRDGYPKEQERGIDAFLQILAKSGMQRIPRAKPKTIIASSDSEFTPSRQIILFEGGDDPDE